MSALDEVFAIYGDGLRALADFIDPPEPCGHDYDVLVTEAPEPAPTARTLMHAALDEAVDQLTEYTGINFDADLLAEETRRAEGTQHAQAPGEVSDGPSPDLSPSPGDLPRCAVRLNDELGIPTVSPIVCDLPAAHVGEHISYEHPDQATIRWPRVSVSHEDLAANITTSRRASEEDGWGGTAIDDHIASGLLADFHITKK